MPRGIFKRKPTTEEHRKNLSESHRGYVWSKEQRKKLSLALKGKNTWSKGKKLSEEHKTKIRFSHVGKKYKPMSEIGKLNISRSHLKENYSYSAVHKWVSRWGGTPKLCQVCGTRKAKKYEWANIDHKYRRILEDYIRMCTSCHIIYDNNKFNFRKRGNRKG
jgi:hypothetical protein